MSDPLASVGVIVIGRNEADHLRACLTTLPPTVAQRVYVDSASSDASPDVARQAGADVVELDRNLPMSAARGRNAGFERLLQIAPDVRYIHFIDGDCELEPGWLDAAVRELEQHARVAAVWGLYRERFPDASVYNRIYELEWREPAPGDVGHTGGTVLIRVDAFRAVGGYDPVVVASEDHELSARLRAAGWHIRRIAVPMLVHDAKLTHFSQWWRRGVRRGVGYGQFWSRHHQRREAIGIVRVIVWGAVIPIAAIACTPFTHGWSLLALALYPLRVAKIAIGFVRRGGTTRDGIVWGMHCVGAAFPYLCGLVAHVLRRVRGKESGLVEYHRKQASLSPVRGGEGRVEGPTV